jgi:hypothetical protein
MTSLAILEPVGSRTAPASRWIRPGPSTGAWRSTRSPVSVSSHRPPWRAIARSWCFFSRRDADLTGLRTFLCLAAQQALDLNLKTAYATCTDRLLPVYRHIGGQMIDQHTMEGEQRTRLRFDLQQLAHLRHLI